MEIQVKAMQEQLQAYYDAYFEIIGALPIDFTSDESKKSHRMEERYLYLRYLFLAVIGSSAFLYFSFAYPVFLVPIAASGALLALVEYKRTHSKRQKIVNATAVMPVPKREAVSRPEVFESRAMPQRRREPTKPEDVLTIVAPACIGCAVIFIAAYQSLQEQLRLQLANSPNASIDLAFAIFFGASCFILLGYIGVLLRQRSKLKKESLRSAVHSAESEFTP